MENGDRRKEGKRWTVNGERCVLKPSEGLPADYWRLETGDLRPETGRELGLGIGGMEVKGKR